MSTAFQKYQDTITQLNSALLTKDQLTEQLEVDSERVKALRYVLAGAELGRQLMAEMAELATAQAAATPTDPA
jgi:CHAD domain-containing protein